MCVLLLVIPNKFSVPSGNLAGSTVPSRVNFGSLPSNSSVLSRVIVIPSVKIHTLSPFSNDNIVGFSGHSLKLLSKSFSISSPNIPVGLVIVLAACLEARP